MVEPPDTLDRPARAFPRRPAGYCTDESSDRQPHRELELPAALGLTGARVVRETGAGYRTHHYRGRLAPNWERDSVWGGGHSGGHAGIGRRQGPQGAASG